MLLFQLISHDPLINNVVVTVFTFIYVFGLVALMDYFVKKHGLPQDISRKITHIGAGSLIIFWALYTDGDGTEYLNISVLVLWLFLLVMKGLFADPNDEAVMTMTRTGDRKELLRGPLYFVIVAILCGTVYYKSFEGIMAMAALGWGDGIAPIIGTRYGKLKYKILSQKSVEGSLSVFAASFAAGCFFIWLLAPEHFDITRILIFSVIATIAEGISPKELDNFFIPASVIILAQFL
jgi:dolichol kinase